MDATRLLDKDHEQLCQRLCAFAARKPQRHGLLVTELVEIHRDIHCLLVLQDEIFYPALLSAARTPDDAARIDTAASRRLDIAAQLARLIVADPDSEEFEAELESLRVLVQEYCGEESAVFARAREILGAIVLDSLGEQMLDRKQQLLQSHARRQPTRDCGQPVTASRRS